MLPIPPFLEPDPSPVPQPFPALDQQTWEAGASGLEGRMDTMINVFSRTLFFFCVCVTLTFSNLLMSSG